MSPVYSLPQLEAALWAQAGSRVHAVLDGRVLPGLPQRLQASGHDWDCLQRGALSAPQAAQAAYIVELRAGSALLRWLLDEATPAFAGWGVLMRSMRPLLAMRELARDLAQVRLPDGRSRPWRWWDPELLDVLLPSCSAEQRDQVFAAGQVIVTVSPQAWLWWAQVDGLLRRDERRLIAA